MPVVKSNGDAGLLATEGAFESEALILPNYLDEVNNKIYFFWQRFLGPIVL